MNWGAEDILAAALLVGAAGTALAAMLRLVPSTGMRIGLGLAILAAAALTWAQLAVGLF